jgi:hypothetical protein
VSVAARRHPVLGISAFAGMIPVWAIRSWNALYHRIEQCGLFLLFWSKAANSSEWVGREAKYALDRQASADAGLPEIRPVILGTPPVEPPWPELAHLHFNDALIYLAAR